MWIEDWFRDSDFVRCRRNFGRTKFNTKWTVVERHSCLLTITMGVSLYTARCRSVYTERDVMVFRYTRPRPRPQRSPASAFSALAVGLRFLLFLPSSSPLSPSFGGAVELGMREALGLSSGLGARLGRGRSGVRIGSRRGGEGGGGGVGRRCTTIVGESPSTGAFWACCCTTAVRSVFFNSLSANSRAATPSRQLIRESSS